MSATRDIEHNGKTIKITVAKAGAKYVGSFIVAGTDPLVRGTGADETSEEEALHSAERHAKELLDKRA